jgi:small ligand-binding sensory domain FIST
VNAFRCAHASGASWQECVDACVAQLGPVSGGLGFVYFTDALEAHAERIIAELRGRTGIVDWVGTVGVGIVASGIEYLDQPALAIMATGLREGEYHVFSGRSRAPETPGASHFGVVHADPNTPDVAALIADMSAKVESGYLVGGLSSSRGRTVQVAKDVLSGGISGVVLSREVGVTTRLTQGCTPLAGGTARHRVTECVANVLVTLDGRPALDVFREDIGELLARDLERAAQFVHVGLSVPGSGQSDRRSGGDYLVRNVVAIDPRQKMIAIGDEVERNAEILFCKRDAASAREDLGRILGELKQAVSGPARGGLYFSCIGRGEHMFGRRGAELEQVRDALGDLPLVGFFCSGEISHDRLYGYTGVLTVFH